MKKRLMFLSFIVAAVAGAFIVTARTAGADTCPGTDFECYKYTAYWEPVFYCAGSGSDCLRCCHVRVD